MNEDLQAQIDNWLSSGVITEEQAAAMRAEQVAESNNDEGASPTFVASPENSRRDLSFVIEGLAYVGGGIVVATALSMLGLYWEDLTPPGRVGIPAVLTIALFVAGLGLVGPPASFKRVGSVLWAASVVFLTGTGATILAWIGSEKGLEFQFLGLSLAVFAFATALYYFRQLAMQQVALAASTLGATAALIYLPQTSLDTFYYAFPFWAVGVIWILLSWAEVLKPRILAEVLGSSAIVLSTLAGVWNESWEYPTWLLVSAIALVAVGIGTQMRALFIVGAIGIAIAAVEFSVIYLGSAIGALLGLFLVGATILATVIILANLRKSPTTPEPEPSTPEAVTNDSE